MVRGRANAKGKAKKSSTVKPVSATASKAKSKAAFVRADRNLSPKEIVEKAKAEGLKLDVGYVYNVRGADKMRAKKKRAANKSTTVSTLVNGGGWTVSANAPDLLKAVAAEIGLGPAIETLAGERARVQAVFGG
jgi:hypothetical protein